MARLLERAGRWLRQSPTGQALAARLGAAYIRLVGATTRWEILGQEHRADVLQSGRGVVTVFWHGRLFLSPLWPPGGRRAVAMISNNRDGDLIAAICARFGVHTVRGSTYDRQKARDKGGAEAFADAHDELTQEGALLGITPDGPRGPRMRAQPGAALLALQTGSPVLPIAFSVRRGKVLRSWDRFLLPWPFGRGVQVFGTPLWPPEEHDQASVAAFGAQIEAALTAVTDQADRMCGRAPVTPASPAAP